MRSHVLAFKIERKQIERLWACLHGGGGPQVGEVTRLSIKSLILI